MISLWGLQSVVILRVSLALTVRKRSNARRLTMITVIARMVLTSLERVCVTCCFLMDLSCLLERTFLLSKQGTLPNRSDILSSERRHLRYGLSVYSKQTAATEVTSILESFRAPIPAKRSMLSGSGLLASFLT